MTEMSRRSSACVFDIQRPPREHPVRRPPQDAILLYSTRKSLRLRGERLRR
jgi:hypothetical protein